MSILREVVGAVCCCLPDAASSDRAGLSRDQKKLSDWRDHPTLAQYDLDKHIADGGFSEIWLARSRFTGKECCIKVVNLRKPGLLPSDVEILRGEARFLRLLDHPGLPRCRDVFETKYHMVMILEYLSGGQMLDHLHRVEHYSEAQAARLFAQVVGAVSYMHNLNIVHRDIKPENVMFALPVDESVAAGRPLRVKLIDLGMATVLVPQDAPVQKGLHAARGGKRGRRWLAGSPPPPRRRGPPRGCLGSPGFIAPEVVHGAVHTLAMDVYALGVLLFVMLTGRKPWSLRDCRNLSYAARPIREAPGLKDPVFLSLSPAARELLLAMLADEPRARPTCLEVLRHAFMTQSLFAGGAAARRQPPLGDLIKRRIAQLASLRRFRGLAFAMIASRREGQDLAEFTQQLTERRRVLHKDLLVRAKTRQSLDLQRNKQRQTRDPSTTSHLQAATLPPLPHPLQKRSADGAALPGTTEFPPTERRLSTDSACSQQPLLRRHQQPMLEQRPSFILTVDSTGDVPNHLQDWRHQQHPQWLKDSPRHSFDSPLSSASSRQLLALSEAGAGAGDGVPMLSHQPSHRPGLDGGGGGGSPGGGSFRQAGSSAAAAVSGRGDSQVRPLHHLQHYRLSGLDTVVEPQEEEGTAGATEPQPQPAAAPPVPQRPAAGTAGTCRGWSSSGQPPTGPQAGAAAPPPQQPPRQLAARSRRGVKDAELELAAVDPLALIRELPAMGPLGRAHSAPESLAASLVTLLGVGLGPEGRRVASATAAAGSGGGADAMMQRVALGADMRAFSANSFTLDLLENATLMAALTGLPLAHQASSSNFDASLHGSATRHGAMLAAMLSAASGPGATAALQRLHSDSSRGGLSTSGSRDASVHQQMALALLTGAAAGASGRNSTEGGKAPTVFATAAAAAAAAAAMAAAAAETPTRSEATIGSGVAAVAAQPNLASLLSADRGDVGLLQGGGLGAKRASQPRALFEGHPAAPSLDGVPEPPRPPRPPPPTVQPYTQPLPATEALIGGRTGLEILKMPVLHGTVPEGRLPLLSPGWRGYRNVNCNVPASYDVTYTALHLSASSRQLGVALPTAVASPAAAAAVATATVAMASPALALAPALPEPIVRRPSLAFVDMDEQIAARTFEESVHGGMLWFGLCNSAAARCSSSGSGGGSPTAASASDTSSQNHSSLPGAAWEGVIQAAILGQAVSPVGTPFAAPEECFSSGLGLGLGRVLHQESRGVGQTAAASPFAHPARSPPNLARITESSDVGDTSTKGDAAAFAACTLLDRTSARSSGAPVQPVLPTAQPPPSAAAAPLSGVQAVGSSGNSDSVRLGGPPAPAIKQAGHFRSPFEALAVAPMAEEAAPDAAM